MEKFFTGTIGSIKKFLGFVPTGLTGTQATAATAVSNHLVGIGSIMVEGGVNPAYVAVIEEKLLELNNLAGYGITHFWNGANNPKPGSY